MMMAKQAEEVLAQLATGKRLGTDKGATELGSDEIAPWVLHTLVEWYEGGHTGSTEGAARAFRTKVGNLVGQGEAAPALSGTQGAAGAAGSGWRFHGLAAENYRGLTEWEGEPFEYDFSGLPHHIYGPNASGKSCILSAIVWCLTGHCLRERQSPDEATQTTALYANASDHASRIRDWPDVVTIPHRHASEALRGLKPHCRVQVELRSGERVVTVERAIDGTNEFQAIREGEQEHGSLSDIGISPLDEEVALLLPARAGALAYGKDAKLSENLMAVSGLDDLRGIGRLARGLAKSTTSVVKGEREDASKLLRDTRKAVKQVLEQEGVDDTVRTAIDDAGKGVERASAATPAQYQKDVWAAQAAHADALAEKAFDDVAGALDLEKGEDDGEWTAEERNKVLRDARNALSDLRHPSAGWKPLATWAALDLNVEVLQSSLTDWATNMRTELVDIQGSWQRNRESSGRRAVKVKAAHYIEETGDDQQCPVCDRDLPDAVRDELARLAKERDAQYEVIEQQATRKAEELSEELGQGLASLQPKPPTDQIRDMLDGQLLGPLADLGGLGRDAKKDTADLLADLAVFDGPPQSPALFDDEWPDEFTTLCQPIRQAHEHARDRLALANWLKQHVNTVATAVEDARSATAERLTAVKGATQRYRVYRDIAKVLRRSRGDADAAEQHEAAAAFGERVRAVLRKLAPLDEYAKQRLETYLAETAEAMDSYYDTLYPGSAIGPGGLVNCATKVGTAPDCRVTLRMAVDVFADAELIANQGRMRGLLWAFAFALLDRQAPALQTVVIDDPFISLDDYADRNMLQNVLAKVGERFQFLSTIHDEHLFHSILPAGKRRGRYGMLRLRRRDANNRRCRKVEEPDRLAEAVREFHGDHDKSDAVFLETRRYIERNLKLVAEDVLTQNCAQAVRSELMDRLRSAVEHREGLTMVGTQMCVQVSELLSVIDLGNIGLIDDPGGLSLRLHGGPGESRSEIDTAKAIRAEHPRWERAFRDVFSSLDAALARASVTAALAADQADELDPEALPFVRHPVERPVVILGDVAAEGRISVHADSAGDVSEHDWPDLDYALVTSDVLTPVARSGQIAMFAPDGTTVKSGDLALMEWGGVAHLRRVHERALADDAPGWTGQVISHHARDLPPVVRHSGAVTLRKLVGVMFTMGRESQLTMGAPTSGELARLPKGPPDAVKQLHRGNMRLLRVVGDSADPVALPDQYLLVSEIKAENVLDNSLCAVELVDQDGEVWEVLKRFTRPEHDPERVFLQPINTEQFGPIIEARIDGDQDDLPRVQSIRVVWGVLFDHPETFAASV